MTLEDYILEHIDPEPEWLRRVDRDTNLRLYNPRMCSGHLQGHLLKMLVQISGASRILELGTYSAYSTLCMAEGLPPHGEIHTVEVNDELEDLIRHNLSLSPYGDKVCLHIGDACRVLEEMPADGTFDFAFIDADKRRYADYYRLIKPHMRAGGVIVADNTLWDGPRGGQRAPLAPDARRDGVQLPGGRRPRCGEGDTPPARRADHNSGETAP